MLVVGLGDERETPARIERGVGDGLGPERDPGDRDDTDARVLPAYALARRRIPQLVTAPGALEPEPQTFAQISFRTAADTRSTDGM